MDSQARPEDVLLAYNGEFTGFTSVSEMAQPLEPFRTGVLGGTADPDGYYEDFSARLDRFVRDHPRLGGGGPLPGPGGIDWGAVVVAFDPLSDSDGADDADDADDDADDGADDADDDTKGGDPPPAVMTFSEFIVEADGGKRGAPAREDNLAADEALGGEMDETDAEELAYAPAGMGPFATVKSLPLDLNRPEPPSILEYVTEL